MGTKILVVGSRKYSLGKRSPIIRLAGLWLNEIGFEKGTLVNADLKKDSIVLKRVEPIRNIDNIGTLTIKNRFGLYKIGHGIRNKKNVPCFMLSGFWIEDSGFCKGNMICLQYEYGVMTITNLGMKKAEFRDMRIFIDCQLEVQNESNIVGCW